MFQNNYKIALVKRGEMLYNIIDISRCDGMADVTDSKSVGGDTVWVQVPPPAPRKSELLSTDKGSLFQ